MHARTSSASVKILRRQKGGFSKFLLLERASLGSFQVSGSQRFCSCDTARRLILLDSQSCECKFLHTLGSPSQSGTLPGSGVHRRERHLTSALKLALKISTKFKLPS